MAVSCQVTILGLVTLMTGIDCHFLPYSPTNEIFSAADNEARGAVAGRIVSIPAKAYRQAFKADISLGQCPLVREENGSSRDCSAEFTGTAIFLPKSSMTADSSRVESSEDILLHVMGGYGTSVGVLGLVSVSPKINVAVTTETSKKTLGLISSYELLKGVVTLQNPRPKETVNDSTLFLSEIEIGGSELFLVTLEFESEKQKVDVQVTVTFKIVFISISAKLRYVNEKFNSKAWVRIQFKSSWRKELDETFDSLEVALPRVLEIEELYMKGPQLLREMKNDEIKSHHFYYFSSWKESPYGKNVNLGLVNHDLEFLMDQNTEMKSVVHRISELRKKFWKIWSVDQREAIDKLDQTLTQKISELTSGLDSYHLLSPSKRQDLRDVYGQDKAPLYYTRELNSLIGE